MPLEYISLSSKEYDRISAIVRKHYPKSCILWIEENKNAKLLEQYAKEKEQIQKKFGTVNEVECFHGTSYQSMLNIIEDGFNKQYNHRSAYGKGTYFAISSAYSKEYAIPETNGISYMFICYISYGSKTQGSANLVIDTNEFDCAVDYLANPSIYVIPNDNDIYPKYVIAFHKNAQ